MSVRPTAATEQTNTYACRTKNRWRLPINTTQKGPRPVMEQPQNKPIHVSAGRHLCQLWSIYTCPFSNRKLPSSPQGEEPKYKKYMAIHENTMNYVTIQNSIYENT
jgi:hypothetical protein